MAFLSCKDTRTYTRETEKVQNKHTQTNRQACWHFSAYINEIWRTKTHPTFGNPTIPILSEVPNRPMRGGSFGPSPPFFGGICKKEINKQTN